MSRFFKNISLFLVGLPALSSSNQTATASAMDTVSSASNDPSAVPLRPLNRELDNLFARHSSHSSHRSHASHSSGSGGYSSPPPPPLPASAPLIERTSLPPIPNAPTSPTAHPNSLLSDPATPALQPNALPAARTYHSPAAPLSPAVQLPDNNTEQPTLSRAEKLKLQIMRVQIKLTTLGLYDGRVDGTLNAETKAALGHFQVVKGLPQTGMMTTPTLNALGIPAVN